MAETIAFHGDPHGRPDVIVVPATGGEARVWKMPADGGDAVQVTTSPAVASVESRDGRDLFYVERANRTSPLWRLPLAGGNPVKVLDGVVLSNFDVVDFATGRPTAIAHDLGRVGFGLSASPDGRTVYYSRTDSSVEELMVVDNFR